MPRYAQIVGNIVHGVYEYDPLPPFAPNIVMRELPPDSPVEAGWLFDGEGYLPPPPEPEAAYVPLAVSMRQARHAMLQAGILGAVQTMIEQMPGEEGDAARIDWEFAQEVKRSWPLVVNLGPALGLTEQQIDDLFRYAATIPQ